MTSPVRAEVKAATAVRNARRRRTPSIGFQFRALLPVIVYGALFIALTAVFLWIPMHRQLAADPSPVIKAILAAQLFRIELWLATFLLISGGIASVHALLRARRLAAPVEDLREHLAQLGVGQTEPLVLQPGDEFRELEAPFNAVVNRVDYMTRDKLEMLRLLRRNLEGIAQRSADLRLTPADLDQSIAVLLRDIDSELKKLQWKA
jgi:hypothetical protein